MSVATIQVPCGCVFEAEGEMAMLKYCPECEAAMAGHAEVHSCPDCDFTAEWPEELDAHIVEVHLGIVLAPLCFVIPPVSNVA
ncbi:MAG: hypothetical protein ACT4OM_13345 [Actinomycetota bacterium]